MFPFKYDGGTYDKCTNVNDPDDKLWCSTKVDEYRNHDQSGGYWGHCGQDCTARPLKENAEFSISSKGWQESKFNKNCTLIFVNDCSTLACT